MPSNRSDSGEVECALGEVGVCGLDEIVEDEEDVLVGDEQLESFLDCVTELSTFSWANVTPFGARSTRERVRRTFAQCEDCWETDLSLAGRVRAAGRVGDETVFGEGFGLTGDLGRR